MTNGLTLKEMARWCDTKGDEEYYYGSIAFCAVTQYAESLGLETPYHWSGVNPFLKNSFWYQADKCAQELWRGGRRELTPFRALAIKLRSTNKVS